MLCYYITKVCLLYYSTVNAIDKDELPQIYGYYLCCVYRTSTRPALLNFRRRRTRGRSGIAGAGLTLSLYARHLTLT